MESIVTGEAIAGLERSCTPGVGDWVRIAPACPGFERIEAFFGGHAYDPHRHDTYALGLTLGGVQAFRYRGARQESRHGNVIALHPDEVHDGGAGSETGFRYRMLYLAPEMIMEALGDRARSLPFVREAVSRDGALARALADAFSDLTRDPEPMERDHIVAGIAQALLACDPSAQSRGEGTLSLRHAMQLRDYLAENCRCTVASAEIEAETGLDRFRAARHFRRAFGTSPYRYLTMRRLDHARLLIGAGRGLAEVAAESGFADQAHMTRQFRGAFGITPGRYRTLSAS